MVTTSTEVDKILPALLEAKRNFTGIHALGVNTFLNGAKYVKLDDLLDAITPALDGAGILIVNSAADAPGSAMEVVVKDKSGALQPQKTFYPGCGVTTRLWHVESGQYVETTTAGLYGDDRGISLVQSQGKLLTYFRRYNLVMLLSLGTEADDDAQIGNQPGANVQNQRPAQKPQANGKVSGMSASEFKNKWLALYGGDADAAGKRYNEALVEANLTWDQVKGNGQKLQTLYNDEESRLAKAREQGLASELERLAKTD